MRGKRPSLRDRQRQLADEQNPAVERAEAGDGRTGATACAAQCRRATRAASEYGAVEWPSASAGSRLITPIVLAM